MAQGLDQNARVVAVRGDGDHGGQRAARRDGGQLQRLQREVRSKKRRRRDQYHNAGAAACGHVYRNLHAEALARLSD